MANTQAAGKGQDQQPGLPEEFLYKLRHSTSHVMAEAVLAQDLRAGGPGGHREAHAPDHRRPLPLPTGGSHG